MNKIQFEELLDKYLLEKISRQETARFFSMLDEPEYEELLKEHIGKDFLEGSYDEREDLVRRERIKQKLAVLRMDNKKTFRLFTFPRIAAAAAILILFSTGAYFYFNKKSEHVIAKTENKNDVAAPQTNKAVLTLSDGSKIILDSAGNGSLAVQGNVKVVKTADGQIIYKGDATEIKYNTLTVPKGSKPVQLQLADGSKVWLNVASSITYPTAFSGNERKIQITGEAYFEIAHNTAMPFVVEKNDVSVQVLGTHFNVNSYDDEAAIKVTLLEGSVKVTKGNQTGLLKPGQQAQLTDKEIKVVSADVDEVMAWKNGLFSFDKVDLQTVLRQLTKWYDVDVEYQGNVPRQTFGGDMERTLSLSQVLKVLEKSEVHFKIEDKKIIVMP
ncbi:MAG: FecR family protein [Chitinophagaceae bacterium]|nr:FecR family protein [Chitinophagaceae bacterium]